MKTIRMTLLMKLVLVAFVLFSLLTILQLRMKLSALNEKCDDIRMTIEQIGDENEKILEQLEENPSRESIIMRGHDEGYCFPGEYIIYNDR